MNKKLVVVVCIVAAILLGLCLFLHNQKERVNPAMTDGVSGDNGEKLTDAELEAIIAEHGNTDSEEIDDFYVETYGEGDFQIEGEALPLLAKANEGFEQIVIGKSTAKDLLRIMGDADEVQKWDFLTEYFYTLVEGFKVGYSVRNSDQIVIEKNIILFSDDTAKVQLSKEIGTELVNLPEKIKEISLGMKLEEIVAILGDKYACLAETEYGKTYAWYDTWENGVGISFDNNNISTYMTGAGAYQY